MGRVWLLPMGGSGRVWCVRVGRGGGGVPGSNGSLGAPARRAGCWLLAGWVWQLGLAVWLVGEGLAGCTTGPRGQLRANEGQY